MQDARVVKVVRYEINRLLNLSKLVICKLDHITSDGLGAFIISKLLSLNFSFLLFFLNSFRMNFASSSHWNYIKH